MTYNTYVTFEGDRVVARTVNAEDETLVYATVVVTPSTGFERNAVVIETDFRAEDQSDVDTDATGTMRDDAGRALAAALTAHYARKDGA